MFKEIAIEQYLSSARKVPVIDVRSPKEFGHAHIPGAMNLPLFTDEERAVVGITYKHEGREKAIAKGLEIVGPKMGELVQKVLSSGSGVKETGIVVHCWRGGMRSKSMATLFDFAGIKTQVIKGGYKQYRQAARKTFLQDRNIIVLGGKTGSAKTKILHTLRERGEQVIDLERIANHKGSAFGDLGEDAQPSTEMFENLLCEALLQTDPSKRVWIEDESHLIGTIFIPEEFWAKMRSAPVIYCDFPIEERINYLVNTYGHFEQEGVINAVKKITKRLGGQHAKAALEHYAAGNLAEAVRIVLVYYDQTYQHGLSQRNPGNIHQVRMQQIDPEKNANEIIQYINTAVISQQPGVLHHTSI